MTASLIAENIRSQVGGCVREIVCGLRHDLYSRFSVGVLKAFIDDSGSGGDSPWYVLAGYIGTVEGWDSFDAKWTAALHAHPRIEYFKASEAESLRPESDSQWRGISSAQRDAKIDSLIAVISQCARRAICARMRQRDYDDIVKGNLPPMWDSPYFFLSTILIGATINIERLDGEGDHIDFVFDDDERHRKQFPLMVPPLRSAESFYGRIVNVVRRNEKDFLPLQAADLLAWQIRRFFSVTNEPRRRHFDASQRSLPKEPHTFVLDRAKIVSVMNDMRESAARIVASLGRSPDVRTWD